MLSNRQVTALKQNLNLTRDVQHVIDPAGDPVISVLVPPAAWGQRDTRLQYTAILTNTIVIYLKKKKKLDLYLFSGRKSA